jgi:hypothetical protein
LRLTFDTFEFALGNPPRSRAAQNWPLAPVVCGDGDVIAIKVGIAANNQSNTLAESIGFLSTEAKRPTSAASTIRSARTAGLNSQRR